MNATPPAPVDGGTSENIVPPLNIRFPTASETISETREDVIILWVGAVPHNASQDQFDKKIQQVNHAIRLYDDLKLATDAGDPSNMINCFTNSLEYIELMKQEKFLIIVSYSTPMTSDCVREYLAEVNQKRQVDSILILDISNKLDDSCFASFTKVSLFHDFDKLFAEITKQVELILLQLVAFNLFEQKQRTTKDLTKESASFLWFQVLVDALKKMPKNKNSFKSMLTMCKNYYNTRKKHLDEIAEFERDYKVSDAVKWYTKESFLYRLLNKALRTEDVTSLYLFRTFIVDLSSQLEMEFEKMKLKEDELIVYRGQQMSESELNKLQHNEKNLISTNGFFSTTRRKDIAMGFAKTSSARTDLTPVLFEIRASTKLGKVVFADITSLSEFAREKEVLFSLGAVFQIVKFEYDNTDNMCKVHMAATDEGSKDVAKLVNRTSDSGKRMLFGELLLDMGKYTESQKYFETMREQMNSDDTEVADIYHNPGRAYGYKGDFKKALENFNRAYDLRSRTPVTSDYSLPDALNSLGVIYGEQGEYGKAKKRFNDALTMVEQHQTSDTKSKVLHIAQSHSNLGWIHFLKGEYQQALGFHQQSLNSRKQLLGDDFLLLADNYSSIGAVQHALGQFDKAMENYNIGFKIRQLNLPSDHPSIASIYQAIGAVHHESGRYDDALENYKHALDIRAKALGPNHSSVATVYKSIGGVYLDQGEYGQALKQYMRALEICVLTLSESHPSTGDCYHSLGMLCERQNHFEEAVKHYVKAREIITAFLPSEHPSIAKVRAHAEGWGEEHPDIILTYNAFGVLYRLKKDYPKAKEYFQRADSMCQKYFLRDHPMKARILHNMGDMYTDMGDFHNAIGHYEKAYKMREATLPPDDLSTASSYYNLGCAYFEKNNKVKAITMFEKTLGIYQKQRTKDEKAIQRVKEAINITNKMKKQ
ncbi:unnamed protein product [Rotaria magnacalcarata]|uniref:NAD(P)(+)--arginine ADP-ribosyltransferase n=1 Tax=Rotaria magnacalcarata TaxID=392030 RepID=A0A816ALD3_9BILA|nr:unnamed protein product [Rotaria magnacalcarata]